jgi:hypothetical protein
MHPMVFASTHCKPQRNELQCAGSNDGRQQLQQQPSTALGTLKLLSAVIGAAACVVHPI